MLAVCRGDVRGTSLEAVTPLLDPRGCPPGPQMLPAASYGHETVCPANLGWREAGLPGFVGERERCRWDPKHMRAETQGRRAFGQDFWCNRLGMRVAGMPGVAFWIGGMEVMQAGVEVGWGWGAEGLQACWAAVGVRTGLQQGMLDL